MLQSQFRNYLSDYWCSAHMSSSETLSYIKIMNVPEVKFLYECLRTVIKHLEFHVKKGINWCSDGDSWAKTIISFIMVQIIMWHFCKSSTIFDEVLPTVYDTMYTKGAKIEERDPLFSPQHKGSYRSTNNIWKGIPQKFW